MVGPESFAGKTVVVTGGASGIGLAASFQFGQRGAFVAVADVDEARIGSAIESIRQTGGNGIGLTVDAADPAAVKSAVGRVLNDRPSIDILVNSAGIFYNGPAADISVEDWRRVIQIDLDGVFFWSQAVAQLSMIASGSGAIVNVASTAGLVAGPGAAPYTAAKHGVVGLTKALAVEWGPLGLRVNAICPGLTETEMVRNAWVGREAAYAERQARIPSGRSASADDQANAILFLASGQAEAINGLIMAIDGGTSALSSGYSVTHPKR